MNVRARCGFEGSNQHFRHEYKKPGIGNHVRWIGKANRIFTIIIFIMEKLLSIDEKIIAISQEQKGISLCFE